MKLLAALVVAATVGLAPGTSAARGRQVAPSDVTGFIARSHRVQSRVMPYRLFVPTGYDKAHRYPLIVWLHGAGGQGADNVRQISGDQVPGTRLWTSNDNQARHPAFEVAPQSAAAWSVPSWRVDSQSDVRMVAEILDALSAEYSIDRDRVYLIGQSAGGAAAWTLVTQKPARFAAVVLVCPTFPVNRTAASSVPPTPFWVFQGRLDTGFVNRQVIDTLSRSGVRPKLTVYPDLGHNIWTRVFAEPDLVEWLFAQRKPTKDTRP